MARKPNAEEHPAVSMARVRAPLFRRGLLRWWSKNRRSYPWRDPHRTAYEVLVAEMLLKRTTASAAANVYGTFLRRFPSVESISRARLLTIERALEPVGLQRQRAKGFKEMARYVMDIEGGTVPTDVDHLIRIPHVGSYASAAVSSFALDVRAAAVDSNVERIIGRLFARQLGGVVHPSIIRTIAERLLPSARHRDFNLAMLDLAAAVCRYGKPKCEACPVRPTCDYGAD